VGRDASADTDVALHAEILTYSRSRGIYAGISLKGAVVQPDESGNHAMYGDASRLAILNGHVPPPQDAKPFLRAVTAATLRARNGKQSAALSSK
jgi:lipid-binding SYLF domain-containing protein